MSVVAYLSYGDKRFGSAYSEVHRHMRGEVQKEGVQENAWIKVVSAWLGVIIESVLWQQYGSVRCVGRPCTWRYECERNACFWVPAKGV